MVLRWRAARARAPLLTKNDIALVTSHRGKSRGISQDNLLALPSTLSRREEIAAISRAPGKEKKQALLLGICSSKDREEKQHYCCQATFFEQC